MPYYLNQLIDGLVIAASSGDGYRINLKWATAYPTDRSNTLAYNIYIGTINDPNDPITPAFMSDFFNQSPVFIYTGNQTNVNIEDLNPGEMYRFGVRATEYDPNFFDLTTLPAAYNDMVVLPYSLLAADISATDTVIPLVDVSMFPNTLNGTVKIGGEQIHYDAINYETNELIVPGGSNTPPIVSYTEATSNTGNGTINDLIADYNAPTETWTIRCAGVFYNSSNQPIPGTATFDAIGSVSGGALDQYGNIPQWHVDGYVVSNSVLSFSITETSTFVKGDYFMIKVIGNSSIASGRGYNETIATLHNTDGYDGYVYWDPNVLFWPVWSEEKNTRVFECWNRFDIRHYPFTMADGYHQHTQDILHTDLSLSDAQNVGFQSYDYAGWHRTDPVLLFEGACIGSYIGGYQGCSDGYGGVGMQLRGLNIQDLMEQREEELLTLEGEQVCLIQRVWTGITCDCFLPYNEYPENRCQKCYGTGFVVGFQQYFNPRISTGRIMVRFDPVVDDLIATDSGLEAEMKPNCWGLGVPSLHDRDFIVRFNAGDPSYGEEYRYEILNVTRNRMFLQQEGVQKFAVQRIRKTDPIYQVRLAHNTMFFPETIYTTVSSSLGIPPHSHSITISSDRVSNISQINQITGISQGHSHVVQNGSIIEVVGHSHTIILPTVVLNPNFQGNQL